MLEGEIRKDHKKSCQNKSGGQGFEKIKQNNPDFILISPCGFDIKKTLSELNPLLNHHDWKTLKAVKNNKIFILDGNKYFNRSGLSIIPSIEIIKEIIFCVYNKNE